MRDAMCDAISFVRATCESVVDSSAEATADTSADPPTAGIKLQAANPNTVLDVHDDDTAPDDSSQQLDGNGDPTATNDTAAATLLASNKFSGVYSNHGKKYCLKFTAFARQKQVSAIGVRLDRYLVVT